MVDASLMSIAKKEHCRSFAKCRKKYIHLAQKNQKSLYSFATHLHDFMYSFASLLFVRSHNYPFASSQATSFYNQGRKVCTGKKMFIINCQHDTNSMPTSTLCMDFEDGESKVKYLLSQPQFNIKHYLNKVHKIESLLPLPQSNA